MGTDTGGRPTMSKVIEAVYENGILRPLESVPLDEGQT
ncbi:MAG: antitoxin family protein, partial [Armatimonadetes bacterium]|nr:antitoxin family protein [Armatimonadota bacterium]